MFVPGKSCSACLDPVESSTEMSAFGTESFGTESYVELIECDKIMLSSNTIIIATRGDFEEYLCSVCKELLQSNDSNVRNIMVDNPRSHAGWSHLHSWNVKHPLI